MIYVRKEFYENQTAFSFSNMSLFVSCRNVTCQRKCNFMQVIFQNLEISEMHRFEKSSRKCILLSVKVYRTAAAKNLTIFFFLFFNLFNIIKDIKTNNS